MENNNTSNTKIFIADNRYNHHYKEDHKSTMVSHSNTIIYPWTVTKERKLIKPSIKIFIIFQLKKNSYWSNRATHLSHILQCLDRRGFLI